MHIKSLTCNSYCAEYQSYYRKDKMLLDSIFSEPYWSLIESQNGCLDNSNPNSIIGSTVNQFELQLKLIYPQDVFLCHSFLLLIFWWRFCIFLLLTFLSQFWVSLYIFHYIVCCKFWCDFTREISTLSLSLRMWHPVTTEINFFQIVLSKWRFSGSS